MRYLYTETREDTGEVIHSASYSEAEARALWGDDLFQHHFGHGTQESRGVEALGLVCLMTQRYEVQS